MKYSKYLAFFTVLVSVPLLRSLQPQVRAVSVWAALSYRLDLGILSYFAVSVLLATELILLAGASFADSRLLQSRLGKRWRC
jgi:hypothetical protein